MEYNMDNDGDRVRPYYVPISPHMTYHGSIGASTLMSPSLSPSSTIALSNSDSQLPRLPLAPCSRSRSNSDAEIAINNIWKIEFTPFGQQKKVDSSLPDLAAKEDSLGEIAGPEDFTENMEKYIKGTSIDDNNKTVQQQLPENPMGQASVARPVELPATVNAEIEALGDVEGSSDFTQNMGKYIKGASTDNNNKFEPAQKPENALRQAPEVQPVEVPEIFTEHIDILGEVEGPSDFTANMTEYMKGTLKAKKEELREESPEESYRVFEGKAPEAYTQFFDDFDAELTEPVGCSTPPRRDLVTPQLEIDLAIPKQRGPPADNNKDCQIDSLRRKVELLQSILNEREVLLMEQEEELVERTAMMEGKDAEINMLRTLNAEIEGKDTELHELRKLNAAMEEKDIEIHMLRNLHAEQEEELVEKTAMMKEKDAELGILKKLNAEVAGKETDLQKLRKLGAVMKGKDAELQMLRKVNTEAAGKDAELQMLRKVNAEAAGKDAELHKLRKLNAVVEGKDAELQKLSKLNAEHKLDNDRLETEVDASQSLIQTLETKVTSHSTTIAAFETEISALKSANEKLESTHASQIEMMKTTNASHMDMLKVTHASQVDILKVSHASEVNILHAHSAASLASLQSRNMKLKSSLDTLQTTHTTTVAALESEISGLKSTNDKLKGTHASHTDKLKSAHTSEVDILQQSVEYWKRGAAVILKDRDEHVKRVEDLEAEKRNVGWRHASKDAVITMGVRLVYT